MTGLAISGLAMVRVAMAGVAVAGVALVKQKSLLCVCVCVTVVNANRRLAHVHCCGFGTNRDDRLLQLSCSISSCLLTFIACRVHPQLDSCLYLTLKLFWS